MTKGRAPDRRKLSRRHALHLGAAGTAILALQERSGASQVLSSPIASPATESDYAHGEMLIDVESVTEFRADPAAILVGFMPEEDFAEAHIPGSIQLDWPALEVIDTSDESIAAWQEQTSRLLTSLGVTRERPVLVYDAGTLFAARLWWILHYLGHEDKRVLNGGLAAWQQAAGDDATVVTPTTAASSPTASFEAEPQAGVLAQMDEVLGSIDDRGVVIVDARTPDEYTEGHIPGAVNINYPRNALAESPKYWKPMDELRAMYVEAGVTPDKRVVPYCSTGVRSSVTFFTLRLIGYQDVGLYTGSWKEWSSLPDAPKAEGDQP